MRAIRLKRSDDRSFRSRGPNIAFKAFDYQSVPILRPAPTVAMQVSQAGKCSSPELGGSVDEECANSTSCC
jgi:hypothetical protein